MACPLIVTSVKTLSSSWTLVQHLHFHFKSYNYNCQCLSHVYLCCCDSESGVESLRPNGTGVSGSSVSPAPGTEGGSSADLSSSLSQSTEDIAQDMVSPLS